MFFVALGLSPKRTLANVRLKEFSGMRLSRKRFIRAWTARSSPRVRRYSAVAVLGIERDQSHTIRRRSIRFKHHHLGPRAHDAIGCRNTHDVFALEVQMQLDVSDAVLVGAKHVNYGEVQ